MLVNFKDVLLWTALFFLLGACDGGNLGIPSGNSGIVPLPDSNGGTVGGIPSGGNSGVVLIPSTDSNGNVVGGIPDGNSDPVPLPPSNSGSDNNNNDNNNNAGNDNNNAEALAQGRQSYEQSCGVCHGADGAGSAIYPGSIKVADCVLLDCSNQADLSAYIASDMPPGNAGACIDQCADNVAQFMIQGFSVAARQQATGMLNMINAMIKSSSSIKIYDQSSGKKVFESVVKQE